MRSLIRRFNLIYVLILILGICCMAHYSKRANDCKAKGGVFLKGGFDYVCIKGQVVE